MGDEETMNLTKRKTKSEGDRMIKDWKSCGLRLIYTRGSADQRSLDLRAIFFKWMNQ